MNLLSPPNPHLVGGWGLCFCGALALHVTTSLSAQQTGLSGLDRPIPLDGYEELWRIGGAAATEWDAFGSVGTVAFTSAGGLIIHDPRALRVVVVSPKGELVREVAGRGDGPGEFRSTHAVLVGQDDGFIVYDGIHQEFKLFSETGDFLTSVSVGANRTLDWLRPTLTPSSRSGEAFRAVPTASGPSREIQRLILGDGALEIETYYEAWRSEEQRLEDGVTISVTNLVTGEAEDAEAYFPQLRMDRAPNGGLLVVDSSDYAVKIVDSAGRVVRTVCRPISPARVDGRMRRAARDLRRNAAEDYTGMPIVFEAVMTAIDDMTFFPEIPVVTDLRAGWDGEVWVRRRGSDPLQADGPIDVFSPDGAYQGSFGEGAFPMPDALGPEGLAAFVEYDRFDVATVVVARLPLAIRATGFSLAQTDREDGKNGCEINASSSVHMLQSGGQPVE